MAKEKAEEKKDEVEEIKNIVNIAESGPCKKKISVEIPEEKIKAALIKKIDESNTYLSKEKNRYDALIGDYRLEMKALEYKYRDMRNEIARETAVKTEQLQKDRGILQRHQGEFENYVDAKKAEITRKTAEADKLLREAKQLDNETRPQIAILEGKIQTYKIQMHNAQSMTEQANVLMEIGRRRHLSAISRAAQCWNES